MSRGGAPAIVTQTALSVLLREPRYEVIPVRGIEQKVAALPYGATVTVTASPALGIDRTFDVSRALAERGFSVVPHLAARMISGRGHLERLVQRLEGSTVREVFVIGGDLRRRRRAPTATPATSSRSWPASRTRSRASASAGTRRVIRSSRTTSCSRRCSASSPTPATSSHSSASMPARSPLGRSSG